MRRLLITSLLGILLNCGCQGNGGPTVAPPATVAIAAATAQIGVEFATRLPPTAVIRQITPSPPPPPTVPPTPTPIIYTVVAGDTLLGIALANGITLQALQALNPDVQAGLLQIGQGLILPPPPPPAPFASGAAAVPVQLRVVDLQMYPAVGGGIIVLGVVENQGAAAVENVRVQLDLLAGEDEVAGSAIVWTSEPIIPPGESAPFAVRFIDLPDTDLQPQVAINDGQSVVELGSRELALTVEDFTLETEGAGFAVRGAVRNKSDGAVTSLLIVATFYNRQGKISGLQQLLLDQPLAAGAAAPFALYAIPPGGQADQVEFAVFGIKSETE